MADPASASGWYPDPWKTSTLRWHDGAEWTSHVHDPEPPAAQVEAPHVVSADTTLREQRPPQLPTALPTTAPTTSTLAIVALVLALVGVPIVPIVLGIRARREIAASGGRTSGRGLATAGIVLGSINALVLALIVLVIATASQQPVTMVECSSVPTAPACSAPYEPTTPEGSW